MSTKDRLIASAQKNLEKGQIQKAIKDYQELLKLEPKVDQYRQKLADLLCRVNQQGEALEHYDALAKGYAERGFYSKAIAVYKQIQKVDPARTEVYERLAELNRNLGLTGNAMAEYRTLLDLHEKRNMSAEAVGVLQKMVEIEPDNVNLQVRLLQYLLKEKLFDKVRDSLISTCESCYKSGDTGKVQKLFDSILPKLPPERDFHLEIVKKLQEKGFFPAEILVFNALLKNNPDDPFLLEGVSNAHKNAGDTTKEALVLGHLLHVEPTAIRCERLIRIWLEIGECQKALRELEQYEEIFDQNGGGSVLVELYQALQAKLPGDPKVRNALVRLVGCELSPEVRGEVDGSVLSGDFDATFHDEDGIVVTNETFSPIEPVATAPAALVTGSISQPVELSEFIVSGLTSSTAPEAEISLDFLEGLAVEEQSVPAMELVQESDLAPLVDIDFDLTDISTEYAEDTQFQFDTQVSDDLVGVELNISELSNENDTDHLSVRDTEKETELNLSVLTLDNQNSQVVENDVQKICEIDLQVSKTDNDIDLLTEIDVTKGTEFDFSESTPSNGEELLENNESGPVYNIDLPDLTLNSEFDLSTADDEFIETSDALQLTEDVELTKIVDFSDSQKVQGKDQCHLAGSAINSLEDLSLDVDVSEVNDIVEIIEEDVLELEPLDEDDFVSELEELEDLLDQEMLSVSTSNVTDEVSATIDNEFEDDILELLPDTESEDEQYEAIADAEFVELDEKILLSSEIEQFNEHENFDDFVPDEKVIETSLEDNKQQHAIEEIDFYICQGLFEPAEKLCRTILNDDPSHSLAAARLKEVLREKSKIESEADDSFFDLASELLDDGALQATEGLANVGEIDRFRFDSVFSEFKKGVESQIDQEDSEAHYDLGIAYKEMGLIDDAIEEFKKSMRNPKRFADSLILIGICNAEKGAFPDAVAIFESAIAHPDVNDADRNGMKYELGLVYEVWGKPQDALVCFESVASVDHFFRNVGEKIDALRQSLSVNSVDQVVDSPDSVSPGKNRISFV